MIEPYYTGVLKDDLVELDKFRTGVVDSISHLADMWGYGHIQQVALGISKGSEAGDSPEQCAVIKDLLTIISVESFCRITQLLWARVEVTCGNPPIIALDMSKVR